MENAERNAQEGARRMLAVGKAAVEMERGTIFVKRFTKITKHLAQAQCSAHAPLPWVPLEVPVLGEGTFGPWRFLCGEDEDSSKEVSDHGG